MVHLFVIPDWFTHLAALILALAALWKGAWRERLIAWTQVVVNAISHYVCSVAICLFQPDQVYFYAIGSDVILVATCLATAVRGDRYWTIWASSFALLALICDLLAFLPGITTWSWNSASFIWSYLMSAAVLWGVWTTARDRFRFKRA
jgi:hypothetical protein